MKALVLGAGVIGVTTAYELMRDGHEVTIIERHDEPARETSFANAGLIAPGHAFAWASPKVPAILLKSLFRNDQVFQLRLKADLEFWKWTARFIGQCTRVKARENSLRKHRLCVYSQQRLHEVVASSGVEYDRILTGLLYLFRSQQTLDRGVKHMQLLVEDGQQREVLDRDQVVALDPAYSSSKDRIAGAVYCPTDESGDSHLFTINLARVCADQGVKFEYGTAIERFDFSANKIQSVQTDRGEFNADTIVLALGPYSAPLARPLGIHLPIYPVKGYSVTMPSDERHTAPRLGTVDEDNLVAYVRLGQRLRVTATAEFAGYDTTHRPRDFTTMLNAVRSLLPEGGDYDTLDYWSCLRPMTPHGTPLFGSTEYANLFVNTGQGHMGWTMACGSARITADLIAGRTPEIDLAGLRYKN